MHTYTRWRYLNLFSGLKLGERVYYDSSAARGLVIMKSTSSYSSSSRLQTAAFDKPIRLSTLPLLIFAGHLLWLSYGIEFPKIKSLIVLRYDNYPASLKTWIFNWLMNKVFWYRATVAFYKNASGIPESFKRFISMETTPTCLTSHMLLLFIFRGKRLFFVKAATKFALRATLCYALVSL